MLGLSRRHLDPIDSAFRAESETVKAFHRLSERGRKAGFQLAVASAFRGYDRQLAIFNEKCNGLRSVTDAQGDHVSRVALSDREWLETILRYSALPGTSRHHWGTDIDIWDRSSVSNDYEVGLMPSEYSKSGVFAPMTAWLDGLIEADDAEGFFKPYDSDRGGVAPEPWHISYRPVAQLYRGKLKVSHCLPLWRGELDLEGNRHDKLAMQEVVESCAHELFERFVAIV